MHERKQRRPPFIVSKTTSTHNAAVRWGQHDTSTGRPSLLARHPPAHRFSINATAPEASSDSHDQHPEEDQEEEEEEEAPRPSSRQNLQEVFQAQAPPGAGALVDLIAKISFASPAATRNPVFRAAPTPGTTITPALSVTDKAELQQETVAAAAAAAPCVTPRAASAPTGAALNMFQQDLAQAKTVGYFRNLQQTLREDLESRVQKWTEVLHSAETLDDQASGEIQSVLGHTGLLLRKRVAQFVQLCDLADSPEAERSATPSDLEGFWNVVTMQSDDILERFKRLDERQERGWAAALAEDDAEADLSGPRAPRKKKNLNKRGSSSTNPAAKKGRRGGAGAATAESSEGETTAARRSGRAAAATSTAITPRRNAARQRLQRFKQMQKQKAAAAPVFGLDDGADGSAPVASAASAASAAVATPSRRPILTPVRASRKEKELHGTDFMLTPVRRSTRKTPSRFRREEEAEVDVATMLAQTDFAYKPNAMLLDRDEGAQQRSCPRKTPRRQVPIYEDDEEEQVQEQQMVAGEASGAARGESDAHMAVAATPEPADGQDMLSALLFGEAETPCAGAMPPIAEEEEDEEEGGEAAAAAAAADGSPRLSLLAPREATLVSFSPAPTIVSNAAGARAYEAASQLGSISTMATITPARFGVGVGGAFYRFPAHD